MGSVCRSDCSPDLWGWRVGEALTRAVAASEKSGKASIRTVFQVSADPKISISQYCERLEQHTHVSPEAQILAVACLDRLAAAWEKHGFVLGSRNVHRAYVAALSVSSKFVDDERVHQTVFAAAGGVKPCVLMGLERELLRGVAYSIHLTPEAAARYRQRIEGASSKGKVKVAPASRTYDPRTDSYDCCTAKPLSGEEMAARRSQEARQLEMQLVTLRRAVASRQKRLQAAPSTEEQRVVAGYIEKIADLEAELVALQPKARSHKDATEESTTDAESDRGSRCDSWSD
mmetsp:Transcript_108925/g.249937  ORF Transcript_108925/g.249937 Transcript_108925/m.249937 type:complete len:288 (-) Transcript_108925:336-1199(-)